MFKQRSGNVVPNVDPDVRTMFDQRPGNVQATLTQRSRIVGDQNLLRNPGSVSLASLDDMGRDGAVVSNNDQGGKGAGKVSGRRCRVVWGGGKKNAGLSRNGNDPFERIVPRSPAGCRPSSVHTGCIVSLCTRCSDRKVHQGAGRRTEKGGKGGGGASEKLPGGAWTARTSLPRRFFNMSCLCTVYSQSVHVSARRKATPEMLAAPKPTPRKIGVHRPPPAAPSFTSFPVRSDRCDTSCNAVHECQCRLPGEKAQNGNIPRRPSTAATKCRPRTPPHLHQWMSAYWRGLYLNIA